MPQQVAGKFQTGEINVILNYINEPDPMNVALKFVAIGVGVIFALCIVSVILSHNRRKKKLRAGMDFNESLEPKDE